jgi:TctA family transporter
MKTKTKSIISIFAYSSYLTAILSMILVLYMAIIRVPTESIPYNLPIPFFVLAFIGLTIAIKDEYRTPHDDY